MQTKIIEATNRINWGKFLLGRFDSEWERQSEVDGRPLLRSLGWSPAAPHLWVLDLQTGEGAYFQAAPYGHAKHDLNKHRIWVCPLFEPFLTWVYVQDLTDLDKLPSMVELPGAESAIYGYRRPGR
jgi:hypothetical protein